MQQKIAYVLSICNGGQAAHLISQTQHNCDVDVVDADHFGHGAGQAGFKAATH